MELINLILREPFDLEKWAFLLFFMGEKKEKKGRGYVRVLPPPPYVLKFVHLYSIDEEWRVRILEWIW